MRVFFRFFLSNPRNPVIKGHNALTHLKNTVIWKQISVSIAKIWFAFSQLRYCNMRTNRAMCLYRQRGSLAPRPRWVWCEPAKIDVIEKVLKAQQTAELKLKRVGGSGKHERNMTEVQNCSLKKGECIYKHVYASLRVLPNVTCTKNKIRTGSRK